MSLVRIEHAGAVRTVTLNRPEKRNALNEAMMAELQAAFSMEPPPEERVTVLRGEGPAFCAGLQLATSGVDAEQAVVIEAMFDAVHRYPLPTVAVVHGPGVAGGCELALHCDFVVASRQTALAMPLAQLGVATTWFLTKKIMEAAGPVIGREFLLLGDPMPAQRLYDLGIIARVADAEQLDSVAQEVIDRLANNAPLSMRTMKAIMLRQMDNMFHAEHAALDKRAHAVYTTRDAVEGVAARLEKRVPKFEGR
jgi:enoyl-CoA hydratase/carnithine racemase